MDGFAADFERRTGIPLPARRTNRLENREGRADTLFPILSGWAFDHPERVAPFAGWLRAWTDRVDEPAVWELHGYLCYLSEDWRGAANAFLRSLQRDPENLDAWVDLAFALKHMGIDLGEAILFDHEEFIREVRENPPERLDLFTLRALRDRIRAAGRSYAQTYRRWTAPFGMTSG